LQPERDKRFAAVAHAGNLGKRKVLSEANQIHLDWRSFPQAVVGVEGAEKLKDPGREAGVFLSGLWDWRGTDRQGFLGFLVLCGGTCPKEWREIHRDFDWLGAKHGRQLGEVTGIGQMRVREGYALLGEDRREQIENRSKWVSAYAAEKFGIL
jgi:hypothetical protein